MAGCSRICQERSRKTAVASDRIVDRLDTRSMPAGMDDSKIAQVQSRWQCAKPFQSGRELCVRELLQCLNVLTFILLRVNAEELIRRYGIGRVIRQSVELVVTHHGQCRVALSHRSGDAHDVRNIGATIDKVAAEYNTASRVTKTAGLFRIPHFRQQLDQFIRVTVNVSYDVKHTDVVSCQLIKIADIGVR